MRTTTVRKGVVVRRIVIGALGFGLMLGAACDDNDSPAVTGSGSGGSTGTNPGAGGGGGDSSAAANLNDRRVAGIMIEANQGEVHAAELAKSRSTNAAVLQYAQHMIDDYSSATERMQGLLDAKGMQTEDSAVRQNVARQAMETLNQLWATPAESFDLAYADSQILMHTTVLQLLDQRMLPATQDTELKTELSAAREKVAAHLAEAEQLRSSLGGSANGGAAGQGANAGGTNADGTGTTAGTGTPAGGSGTSTTGGVGTSDR